jgi:hypothetical protein
MAKITYIVGWYSCVIGVLNLIGGAAHNSRFYEIDNIVVRIIGLTFVVAGIGLLLSHNWAKYILLLTYIVSIVEILITYDYTHYVASYFVIRIILIVIFFGVPTWVLIRRHNSS